MANLRIDDQRRVAPGQAPGQFDAPDASRGAEFASRQMQQTGQALSQAGQAVGAIYRAEVEKLNETRVNDALNRAQTEALDLRAEYTPLQGEAALAVGENREPVDQVYGARYERRIGEIADELQLTPEQREIYSARAQPLALNFRSGVTNHYLTQKDGYEADVTSTGIAVAQQTILGDPLNAGVTGPNAARIGELVVADRRRRGLPAEGDTLAVQDFVGKAYLDAILATEDEDLEGARQLYDTHRDSMTATQQNAARNALAGGIATQEAAAWVSTRFQGEPAPAPGNPGSVYQHPAPGAVRTSSGYGMREHPITGGQKMHDGVDYAAPAGSPARSIAAGRVIRVGPNGGYGNFVEIDHGNGVVTGYAHLQDFDVALGDEVAAGQNIGRVGSTGDSTGPHLHLRARRDGQSIDPETLIGEGAETAAAQAGAGRPTRAAMEREARAQFGNNRIALAAANAEIARVYASDAAETAAREQAALDAAYRHIEQTNTMPTPQMMAALPPGRANGVQNYLEARLAPPVVRSDPALRLQLAAMTPEQSARLAAKSPEEIIAEYGTRLSPSDLESLVGQSARASAAQRTAARAATAVPHTEYTRAFASVTDLAGIDRTPSGPGAIEARQQLEVLDQGMREWVVSRQVAVGRQLDENEIRQELQSRLARLASNNRRPATGYGAMRQADRAAARQRLISFGMPRDDIDETAIYREYVRVRVTQGN
jgi:murein DD-endopeptidase MepM/ murein hydrolase activator NlpD